MNEIARTPGAGFTEVALGCIIIDMISQYVNGKAESSGPDFMALIDTHFPTISSIHGFKINAKKTVRGNPVIITTGSQAIWNGYRCGILHEANAYMCCIVDGQTPLMRLDPSLTLDSNGNSLDTIVINPGLFRKNVESVFFGYFNSLLEKQSFGNLLFNDLDTNFKKRFFLSFGFVFPANTGKTKKDIELSAHAHWLQRACLPGGELEDWLLAEIGE